MQKRSGTISRSSLESRIRFLPSSMLACILAFWSPPGTALEPAVCAQTSEVTTVLVVRFPIVCSTEARCIFSRIFFFFLDRYVIEFVCFVKSPEIKAEIERACNFIIFFFFFLVDSSWFRDFFADFQQIVRCGAGVNSAGSRSSTKVCFVLVLFSKREAAVRREARRKSKKDKKNTS